MMVTHLRKVLICTVTVNSKDKNSKTKALPKNHHMWSGSSFWVPGHIIKKLVCTNFKDRHGWRSIITCKQFYVNGVECWSDLMGWHIRGSNWSPSKLPKKSIALVTTSYSNMVGHEQFAQKTLKKGGHNVAKKEKWPKKFGPPKNVVGNTSERYVFWRILDELIWIWSRLSQKILITRYQSCRFVCPQMYDSRTNSSQQPNIDSVVFCRIQTELICIG